MVFLVEDRHQLHFHLLLMLYFLYIRDVLLTHIQELAMHYLLCLVSNRCPSNQGTTRVAICQRTHHALLVVDHKEHQRIWYLKCIDTFKCFKECDVLGYNVTGFHFVHCFL